MLPPEGTSSALVPDRLQQPNKAPSLLQGLLGEEASIARQQRGQTDIMARQFTGL